MIWIRAYSWDKMRLRFGMKRSSCLHPQLTTCVGGKRLCGWRCPCWLWLWWCWLWVWPRPRAQTTCQSLDITPASPWVADTTCLTFSHLKCICCPDTDNSGTNPPINTMVIRWCVFSLMMFFHCDLLQLSFGAFLGIVGIHLVENRRPMVSLFLWLSCQHI